MSIRRLAPVFVLSLLAACGDAPGPVEPQARVLLVGADGLEWSVLRDLMNEGRCPNLRALMERGSFGVLGTFIPTWSPVVWTSIATGKGMEEHGVTGFVDGIGREFSSSRRAGRALWNITSEAGLSTNVFGWWITWPVEPVNGVMVSATSASSMADQVWKPALMPGLPDQVHPPELTDRVMTVAERAGSRERVQQLSRERIFGDLPRELISPLDDKLISQSWWSIQSDETFRQVALDLLPEHPADLNLIYFGSTDVVGHRFWRHLHPELYAYAGHSAELDAALADVIPDTYEWFDEMLGEVIAAVPDDTIVMVVSDHGMHEIAVDKPNRNGTTGDHQDGAPGVIVAAGPGIARQGGVERWLRNGAMAPLGSVMDITPTVLALLGVPPARDMRGRVNRLLLEPDVRERVAALGMVPTHDQGFRPPEIVEVPEAKQQDFILKMQALGYMEGGGSAEGGVSIPVNPESFTPDPDAGPGSLGQDG